MGMRFVIRNKTLRSVGAGGDLWGGFSGMVIGGCALPIFAYPNGFRRLGVLHGG